MKEVFSADYLTVFSLSWRHVTKNDQNFMLAVGKGSLVYVVDVPSWKIIPYAKETHTNAISGKTPKNYP